MAVPSAPAWLSPTAGQLSNHTGGDLTGDSITFKVRYTNPSATGAAPGTMRITSTRISPGLSQGVLESDTGWMGSNGTQTSLPAGPSPVGPTCTAVWNNRIYVGDNGGLIYSAPFNGPSVGTWRQENTNFQGSTLLPLIYSIAAVGGFLYVICNYSNGVVFPPLYATINADGTLGAWTILSVAGTYSVTALYGLITGYTDSSGVSYLMAFNGTATFGATLNPDGSLNGSWATGFTAAAGHQGGALYFAQSTTDSTKGTLWAIGGSNGINIDTAAITTIESCTVTKGAIGVWATAATGLPTARSEFGFAVTRTQNNGYFLYVIGGHDNTPTNQATVYLIAANLLGNAWTTGTNAIPSAAKFLGAAGYGLYQQISAAPQQGDPTVVYFGGGVTTVQMQWVSAVTGQTTAAWQSNASSTLSAAQLGTGAAITLNLDGTVDVTTLYNAVISAGLGSNFVAGDLVTVSVQFTDGAKGDPSPITYCVFKIGSAPTISGITVTPSTDGEPTVTFNYNAGAGTGSELSWRVFIYPTGSPGNILADSGVQYGGANSFAAKPAPAFVSGTAYTVSVTITSKDNPMTGASNSATSTATSFTPSGTAPGVPTAITAVADNVNGLITVGWTSPNDGNPAPSVNRIYFRVTGTSAWVLLKDNITAPAKGASATLQLMEQLQINNVSYDFSVSSLSSAHIESAQSSTAAAAINPNYQWPNGFMAMLHIVGNGPAQHAGLFLTKPVKTARQMDTSADVFFGDTAPRYRYGVKSYREISLEISQVLGAPYALDTVINAAFLGNVLCYRDTAGNMIYCGFGGKRPRGFDLYVDDTLELTEAQFTYTP